MALPIEQVKLWKRNAVMISDGTPPATKTLQERIIVLAAELLAIREAQPVAIGEVRLGKQDDVGNYPSARVVCLHEQADWDNFSDGTKLYTAPPAPAVPGIDELRLTFERSERGSDDGFNLHKYGIGYADEATQARWESWLSCRAAMLGGAK